MTERSRTSSGVPFSTLDFLAFSTFSTLFTLSSLLSLEFSFSTFTSTFLRLFAFPFPLYKLFSYFSASEIHWTCLLWSFPG